MAANERSSGGSSFVRLVTPFIYSGFTKGSLPALGPHAFDTHNLSHIHKCVETPFTLVEQLTLHCSVLTEDYRSSCYNHMLAICFTRNIVKYQQL